MLEVMGRRGTTIKVEQILTLSPTFQFLKLMKNEE